MLKRKELIDKILTDFRKSLKEISLKNALILSMDDRYLVHLSDDFAY